MLSQLFHHWQGGGDEQKYRSEVCLRFRGKETHHHRANVHSHKGWSKAEWQLTLHDPSYSGSGGLLERSTAIQSKGAGRCEREGASWAFLSGVPAGVGNGHTTHRESRHFGANPGKSSSPARTTEHPVESRRNSCLWAGQA